MPRRPHLSRAARLAVAWIALAPSLATGAEPLPPWITEPRVRLSGQVTEVSVSRWVVEPGAMPQGVLKLHTDKGDVSAFRPAFEIRGHGCTEGDRATVEGYYMPGRPHAPAQFAVTSIIACKHP